MRPLLCCLLAFSVLAAPAAAGARIDPPIGVTPSQDLRSPGARDAAMHVSYGTPPRDSETPWALLGLAVPLGGGAAWAVRRRARVRVAA
jgi:hypothetical protein